MKSALFLQANVAVSTKLTSKVPFLFGNFQFVFKNLVKNVQFRYGTTGKIPPPPRRQHFRGKFFRCPFQYPKVPLEAGAPPNLLMLPTPLLVQERKLVNRWLSSCYSSVAHDVQPIPWDSKDKEIFAMLDDIYIANKQNPLPICHPTWRR